MKLGVIGGGQVGATLGSRLLAAGHAVRYGSRDPRCAKVAELLSRRDQLGAGADVTPSVTAWADAVILATPGAELKSICRFVLATLPGDWRALRCACAHGA